MEEEANGGGERRFRLGERREGVGIDRAVGGRRVVAVSGVACMLGVHSHIRTLENKAIWLVKW